MREKYCMQVFLGRPSPNHPLTHTHTHTHTHTRTQTHTHTHYQLFFRRATPSHKRPNYTCGLFAICNVFLIINHWRLFSLLRKGLQNGKINGSLSYLYTIHKHAFIFINTVASLQLNDVIAIMVTTGRACCIKNILKLCSSNI